MRASMCAEYKSSFLGEQVPTGRQFQDRYKEFAYVYVKRRASYIARFSAAKRIAPSANSNSF